MGSEISCIVSNSTRIGIGTINKSGSVCRFYTWDGSLGGGSLYGQNESYEVDASGILAVIVVDDTFVIFDTKGRLMQLSGISGTFQEIARLPLEGSPLKLPVSTATGRPVHFNGMSLVNGNIEILINAQLWDTNSTVKEQVPSGIWCFDRRSGSFYPKRSIATTKSGGTITDYGASQLSLVGALTEIEVNSTDITRGSVNGKILVGCDYYTTATVTKSGVFYDDSADTLAKAGILTTQKIFSPNVKDSWHRIYAFVRKFLNSTDKIVCKYRTEEDESVEATITYASTTTFSVPTASFSTAPAVGDEIEILRGIGAGRTAHLTVVTTNGANYDCTVDETITGAVGQTATGRFQSWRKIASFSNQTDDIAEFPIGDTSNWIQFRIFFLWTGKNELHGLTVGHTANQKIE